MRIAVILLQAGMDRAGGTAAFGYPGSGGNKTKNYIESPGSRGPSGASVMTILKDLGVKSVPAGTFQCTEMYVQRKKERWKGCDFQPHRTDILKSSPASATEGH